MTTYFKIQDVLQRVPGIDEKTAKLAIDSCRNNEVEACKITSCVVVSHKTIIG